ncbi:helix-turn-helix transcriptional regulator [Streptomyces sp. NPDC047315]|uniref:helix-turn-helix transcriptional regulator n=1 Tax=Streptomyces sp. NPDC047315 TaxID=3155142 RepID=UPI0033F7B827
MSREVGDNIKRLRRIAGQSQEDLAEASLLSVSTVQKAERGRTVRTETLHAIARGLGVTTSKLFAADAPDPVVGDDATKRSLMPIRAALMPPVGVDGVAMIPVHTPGGLAELRRSVLATHELYAADDFGAVARALPQLLRDAEATVALAEDDGARQAAERVRALTLLVSGKFLTQVRQYDLAYAALTKAIRTAQSAEDRRAAAVGVIGLGWLLLRQDRFTDCYNLAVRAAEEMEPRISDTDPARVGMWGELWMRAAAAAVRDNRPQEAKAARRMVARAAAGLSVEGAAFPMTWGGFGPVTASVKSVEDYLIRGDGRAEARAVLRLSERGVLRRDARKRSGNTTAVNWGRHRLDVAHAHVLLGAHQAGMEVLTAVKTAQPEWIKHQPMARRTMSDILRTRKRTLTVEMRDMAAHLGISG